MSIFEEGTNGLRLSVLELSGRYGLTSKHRVAALRHCVRSRSVKECKHIPFQDIHLAYSASYGYALAARRIYGE